MVCYKIPKILAIYFKSETDIEIIEVLYSAKLKLLEHKHSALDELCQLSISVIKVFLKIKIQKI